MFSSFVSYFILLGGLTYCKQLAFLYTKVMIRQGSSLYKKEAEKLQI